MQLDAFIFASVVLADVAIAAPVAQPAFFMPAGALARMMPSFGRTATTAPKAPVAPPRPAAKPATVANPKLPTTASPKFPPAAPVGGVKPAAPPLSFLLPKTAPKAPAAAPAAAPKGSGFSFFNKPAAPKTPSPAAAPPKAPAAPAAPAVAAAAPAGAVAGATKGLTSSDKVGLVTAGALVLTGIGGIGAALIGAKTMSDTAEKNKAMSDEQIAAQKEATAAQRDMMGLPPAGSDTAAAPQPVLDAAGNPVDATTGQPVRATDVTTPVAASPASLDGLTPDEKFVQTEDPKYLKEGGYTDAEIKTIVDAYNSYKNGVELTDAQTTELQAITERAEARNAAAAQPATQPAAQPAAQPATQPAAKQAAQPAPQQQSTDDVWGSQPDFGAWDAPEMEAW